MWVPHHASDIRYQAAARGLQLLADCSPGQLAGWPAGWMAGRLAGWLAGRPAGWLACWLAGWLARPDSDGGTLFLSESQAELNDGNFFNMPC